MIFATFGIDGILGNICLRQRVKYIGFCHQRSKPGICLLLSQSVTVVKICKDCRVFEAFIFSISALPGSDHLLDILFFIRTTPDQNQFVDQLQDNRQR